MSEIKFNLNGASIKVNTEPTKRLLDVLREDIGLIGPKEGCGEGACGACAVLVNHELINSCIIPIGNVRGDDVLTIEGFSRQLRYKKLADAFAEEGAVQCGFCTPGMILAAEALLNKIPQPDDNQIRLAISGNLCRCTGYHMIVAAIKRAAAGGNGLW